MPHLVEPDWRTHHCAEPVATAILSAAGRDVWAEHGGCPRSWREAAALYRRLKVRTLRELVTVLFGPPIDKRRARRGDPVMMQNALGYCAGEVAVFTGATVPMRMVELAWSARGGDHR